MFDRIADWIGRLYLPVIVTLLLITAYALAGCDTVRVEYADATYERTTLFSDKQISDVQINQTEEGFSASLGKSDTQARIELIEAIGAVMNAAD